jgi:transportin-1
VAILYAFWPGILTKWLQKLNSFTRVPDYIAYLAYILQYLTQEEDRIRTIAGYLLKNNARLIVQASPETAAFVKASILSAFGDSSIMIRNAAGQDIVAFLGVLEPKFWPECLQQLMTMLDSTDLDTQEVSLESPI